MRRINQNKTYVYGLGIDNPIYMHRPGQVSDPYVYYGTNSIGSVTALSDSAGALLEEYEYRPFGEETIFDNQQVAQAGTQFGNPYRFTGRRKDYEESSKFYYYRTRYYSPETGRFISHDSIGDWGDPLEKGNGLAYCGNNPINCIDPSGRSGWQPWAYFPNGDDLKKGSKAGGLALLNAITFGQIDSIADATREAQIACGMTRSQRTWHNRGATITVIAASGAGGAYAGGVFANGLVTIRFGSSVPFAAKALPFITASGGALTFASLHNMANARNMRELSHASNQFHAGITLLAPGPGSTSCPSQFRIYPSLGVIPPRVPGPGTLTLPGVTRTQRIADLFGVQIEVGGSAARGGRRNIRNLNIPADTKGPGGRSDIDFIIPMRHPRFKDFMKELMQVEEGAGRIHPQCEALWKNRTVPEEKLTPWRIVFYPGDKKPTVEETEH